jgi:polygalacturonase
MSGGVRNIRISNVRLLGQRGVHMKTTRGRGGYIENITLTNVTAHAGIQIVLQRHGASPSCSGAHV